LLILQVPNIGTPALSQANGIGASHFCSRVATRFFRKCKVYKLFAPSFQAADLIKVLGIGSVAIGFAFQNILQNFLAGILLLLQEPFRIGDLISVTGIEGNVSDIQARATIITTKEGRQVIIPNATIFTNPVAVGYNDMQKS
jgi:small conductance mechanosensitive channel